MESFFVIKKEITPEINTEIKIKIKIFSGGIPIKSLIAAAAPVLVLRMV